MRVGKWDNSLAVRLSADLVRKLGLKEGDQIDIRADERGPGAAPRRRAEEVLAALERFRGRLLASGRLTRDEAHERKIPRL